uniref:GTP_EFTU_D2 domain-containing protein n=1 Tax=Macrostomum lignano TaxID=282301 RepID=A0A1I8F689_9PLAT
STDADVETLVGRRKDAQPLTEPIIAPIRTKRVYFRERSDPLPGTCITARPACLTAWSKLTHPDVPFSELTCERGLSVKCCPLSLLLPDSRGKSHPRQSDGHARASVLRRRTGRSLSPVRPLWLLVVSSCHRLMLMHRLRHLIDVDQRAWCTRRSRRVRRALAGVGLTARRRSVIFASSAFRKFAPRMDAGQFAERLWGDESEISAGGRARQAAAEDALFSSVFLEPVYKKPNVEAVCQELDVPISRSELKLNVRPLLRLVLRRFFSGWDPLVEAAVRHCPSPADAAAERVQRWYSGAENSDSDGGVCADMAACDPNGVLVIHATKLFPTPDASGFHVFGRVISGTLHAEQQVRVLGEQYTLADEEDSRTARVGRLWLLNAQYRVELSRVPAGNWVLIEGVDEPIAKTATITGADSACRRVLTYRPLQYNTASVVKVAVEPSLPSELPKMLDGLRKLSKSYPLLACRIEESGEHVIMGTGELYLDCALLDLRQLYADIEVKVADPVVAFAETVVETSSVKCFAETPNRRNKLTLIAEPLEKGIAEDIEAGGVSLSWPRKRVEILPAQIRLGSAGC